MDNLGDIRLFVEAAQQGSLSAAGRKMGLTPAAASARLAKLETGLKTRLFERTTRCKPARAWCAARCGSPRPRTSAATC
jgi:DNA-binding transcriptional LysR family regulator